MLNARSYPTAGNLPHFHTRTSLRRYAAVAILLGVLGAPHVSEASPIDYSFFGVLGNCETPFVGGCMNDWAGHSVIGNLAFDESLGTFTAFSFQLIGGNFIWFAPRFPDPQPSITRELSWYGSSGGLWAELDVYHCLSGIFPYPNCQWDVERNTIELNFGLLTSTFGSGGISRRGEVEWIHNQFVSGSIQQVAAVPEPSSFLLFGAGVVGLITKVRRPHDPVNARIADEGRSPDLRHSPDQEKNRWAYLQA